MVDGQHFLFHHRQAAGSRGSNDAVFTLVKEDVNVQAGTQSDFNGMLVTSAKFKVKKSTGYPAMLSSLVFTV